MGAGRLTAACTALVIASLSLSGCASQADWDGSKRLASEECVLAAQLFGEGVADPEDGVPARPSREILAEQLRAHVPEEMHEALDMYAQAEPAVVEIDDKSRDAALKASAERAWAEEALQGWAQLACGPEVVAGAEAQSSEWPPLSQLQSVAGELDGVRIVKIAGALEPDHALAVCEEARIQEAEAQIEVTDVEGFPLAFAPAGGACAYDPILFEGLDDLEGELTKG